MCRLRSAAWTSGVLFALAACGHAAQSSGPAQPGSAAHRTEMQSPPSAVATAQPTATPSPAAAPTASPFRTMPPKLARHVVRLAPEARPRILAIAVSETTVHPGDRVVGSVLTTSNVASVQARIGGYAMTLNKTGVGRFALTYTVNVPWFVRGNFTMRVIATNTRGDTVERTIPLMVR